MSATLPPPTKPDTFWLEVGMVIVEAILFVVVVTLCFILGNTIAQRFIL